jgi:hypothetical protein
MSVARACDGPFHNGYVGCGEIILRFQILFEIRRPKPTPLFHETVVLTKMI